MLWILLGCQSSDKDPLTPAPSDESGTDTVPPGTDTTTTAGTGTAPTSTVPPACGTPLSAEPTPGSGGEFTYGAATTSDGGWAQFIEFDEDLLLGLGEPTEVQFTAASRSDGAVARYDASGALLWARHIGSAVTTTPRVAAAGLSGEVLVTGTMGGTTRFAVGMPDELELDGGDDGAGYIAKFASDGALQWVVQLGAGTARDLLTLDDGAVAVVGSYYQAMVFDPGPDQTELTLAPGTFEDGFVAVLDGADGSLEWAESAAGPSVTSLVGVAQDPVSKDLIVGGNLVDLLSAGPGTATFSNGVSFDDAERDGFVVRYARTGGALDVAVVDGAVFVGDVAVAPVAVLGASEAPIALFGWYSGDVRFGPDEANEVSMETVDTMANAFVAKYDAQLDLLWAVEEIPRPDAASYGQTGAVTPDGGVTYIGQYTDGVTVGSLDGYNRYLDYKFTPSDDTYVAHREADGTLRCVASVMGGVATTLSPRSDGTVLVTGYGSGAVPYYTIELGEGSPTAIPIPTIGTDVFSAVFTF